MNWLLGDHLGSTNLTADANGTEIAELRYYPWGTDRYTDGTTPTDYRYTGQKLKASFVLYYYRARWYDAFGAALSRYAREFPRICGKMTRYVASAEFCVRLV